MADDIATLRLRAKAKLQLQQEQQSAPDAPAAPQAPQPGTTALGSPLSGVLNTITEFISPNPPGGPRQRIVPEVQPGAAELGLVRGAADIAGFPADLAGMAQSLRESAGLDPLRLLPEKVRAPVRAAITLEPLSSVNLNALAKKGVEALGVDPKTFDPDTALERITQRVVREMTGSVIGVGLLRRLSTTLRETPKGVQLLREAVSGLGSGVGGGVAREVTDNPFVEILAQIAGGFGPDAARGAANLARRFVTRPLAKFLGSPRALKAEVRAALRETLGDVDLARTQMAETTAVQELVPAFQPTLAEATGSPGLLAAQRAERAKGTALSGALASQREANIDRVMDKLNDAFLAEGPEGVGDVQRALAGKRATAEARLTGQVEQQQDLLARIEQETAARKSAVRETLARSRESAQTRATRATARINQRVARIQRQAEEAAETLQSSGLPTTEVPPVMGDRVRQELKAIRREFRREDTRLYTMVDPDDKATGLAGNLVDRTMRLFDEAMETFGQRDIPASMRQFLASMRLRALRETGGLPTSSATTAGRAADDQVELQTFIRRNGGIRVANEELASEVEALTRFKETGTTGLLSNTQGKTLQEMAEKAHELGFIRSADKADLLEALDNSLRTGKAYSQNNTDVFGDLIEFFDDPEAVRTAAQAVPAQGLRDVTLSIHNLDSLRKRILQDTSRLTGIESGQARAFLEQFRRAVDQAMEDVATASNIPEVLERLRAARAFHSANIGKFRAGAGGDILASRFGEPRVAGSQVVQQFLRAPEAERAAEFAKTLGGRPAAVAALETYLDNELLLAAQRNPQTVRLDAQKAQRWLRQRAQVLAQFPEMREKYRTMQQLQEKADALADKSVTLLKKHAQRADDVSTLATDIERGVARDVPAELTEAQRQLAATERTVATERAALDKSAAQKFVSDETVGDAMARINRLLPYQRQREMQRIVKELGTDQEARRGFLREMWETFLAQPGNQQATATLAGNPMLKPGLVDRFLAQNHQVLRELMGDEHLKDVRTLARGLTIARRADRPPVAGGPPTAAVLQQGRTVQQLARALAPVSMPIADVKLRLVRTVARKLSGFLLNLRPDTIDTLIYESLFDPDIALTFRYLTTDAAPAVVRSRLHGHLLMLGIGHRTDEDDDEATPTTAAARPPGPARPSQAPPQPRALAAIPPPATRPTPAPAPR